MNEEVEEWRDIPGWVGYYQVSNYGRVRSIDREVRLSNRTCFYRGRILRQKKSGQPGKNYYAVVLSCPDNPKRDHKVHLLVLLAFVGPRPAGYEGCHNDGDRFNNQLINLRWGTHQDNVQDMLKHGRSTKGELNPQSVLTEQDVRDIREDDRTQSTIAKEFGVSQTCISKVRRHARWQHVK